VKLEYEIGDRLRTVEIKRHTDGYEVSVDGCTHIIDAVRVGGTTWSLLVHDGNGSPRRSVEATVIPKSANSGFDVHIDGFHVPVLLKRGLGRRSRDGAAAGARGEGTQRVAAPMPGKVVRVLVTPGEAVKARQGLVVVEAMKMENELRAARDGTVREVLVTEGQSVEAGTALVVVD
jgi:biotin carboxyl carrier protein